MITIYTKPSCVQCATTYRALEKRGITYRTIDVTVDPEALDYVCTSDPS